MREAEVVFIILNKNNNNTHFTLKALIYNKINLLNHIKNVSNNTFNYNIYIKKEKINF